MNRRNFFSAVTAAVVAALTSELPDTIRYRGSVTGRWSAKGACFLADRYGRGLREHSWWRPNLVVGDYHYQHDMDFAKLEVRTLASLQAAWKECLAYKSGDTLIIDEQAYEVFKTSQE